MFSFGHCIIELPLPPPNLSRLVLFSPGKTMPGRKLFNGKPSLMPSYQQNHVNTTIMLSTLRCDMLGCAINANCKFCPKCKNCMSDGFCGKLCKIKNLPKQIQLYGQICWHHLSFSKFFCGLQLENDKNLELQDSNIDFPNFPVFTWGRKHLMKTIGRGRPARFAKCVANVSQCQNEQNCAKRKLFIAFFGDNDWRNDYCPHLLTFVDFSQLLPTRSRRLIGVYVLSRDPLYERSPFQRHSHWRRRMLNKNLQTTHCCKKSLRFTILIKFPLKAGGAVWWPCT